MSLATGIAVGVALGAAQQESDNRIVCQGYIEGFESKGATVEGMHTYSECVQTLHPVQSSEIPMFALKGVIVLLFLCVITGLVYQKAQREFDYIFNGIITGTLVWAAMVTTLALLFVLFL